MLLLIFPITVLGAPGQFNFPACNPTVLGYFPISRVESLTRHSVKQAGSFKGLSFGAREYDTCTYSFEDQSAFVIGQFWEMDSSAKAEALYNQLVDSYQGDKNGVKVPAQKTAIDIGDKSTLAFVSLTNSASNYIFTLDDNVVLGVTGGTNIISADGLKELMRGAVKQRPIKTKVAFSQPTSSPVYPTKNDQQSNWISDHWKLLAGAGILAVLALSILAWRTRSKRAESPPENPLPPDFTSLPPPLQ